MCPIKGVPMPGKDRNRSGKLPDYLTHPLTIAAAAIIGVSLIAGPLLFLGANKAGGSTASPVQEAYAPEVATTTIEPAVAAEPAPVTPVPAATEAAEPKTELIAFYANFDKKGYASLERNAKHIGTLMPMWYHLGSNGKLTFDDKQAARVKEIIARENPDMKVMPIVNNYDKATESWNAPQMSKLIAVPSKRKAIAKHIVETFSAAGYDGINVDFESFAEADRQNLVNFMADLYPLAKDAGLEVSMDVIVLSNTYDHTALSKHVDYLIPMMYDEHWKTSGPGPISSIPWFEKTLDRFLEKVPAEKVVVGMGVYSYDWSSKGGRAKSLTYDAAVDIAASKNRPIKLTEPRMNSAFRYKDGSVTRDVWMLDAMSAFDQLSVASKRDVRGYAIWRLGAEDPALWKVLPNRDALDGKVAKSLEADGRTIEYDPKRNLITGARMAP